jgi:hypothetical protein
MMAVVFAEDNKRVVWKDVERRREKVFVVSCRVKADPSSGDGDGGGGGLPERQTGCREESFKRRADRGYTTNRVL